MAEPIEPEVSPGHPGAVAAVLETCLYAEALEPAAQFYREILRLEPFASVAGRHVFFRCGDGVFLLFDPRATRASEDVPAHGAAGPGHVAFAVPAASLQQWRDWLSSAGIAIEREVRWPSGAESLYLRDPAGNSVELASPAIWSIPEARLFGDRGRAELTD